MFRNRIATDQYRIRGHSMVFLSGLQVEDISELSCNYMNNIWLSIIRHGIPTPTGCWPWARDCP